MEVKVFAATQTFALPETGAVFCVSKCAAMVSLNDTSHFLLPISINCSCGRKRGIFILVSFLTHQRQILSVISW